MKAKKGAGAADSVYKTKMKLRQSARKPNTRLINENSEVKFDVGSSNYYASHERSGIRLPNLNGQETRNMTTILEQQSQMDS